MEHNIIIAGGGTGGHLFPALAIGEEIQLRYPKANIHYMGSIYGLEAKVFPIKDVWHTLLPIRGFQRSFNINSFGKNILLPYRILKSFLQVKRFFDEFSPDIIIGTGGYGSAIPLLISCQKKRNIKIILQEQNSFPGITTRFFAKNAQKICVAFKDANKILGDKTFLTGNPIRKNITNGNAKIGFNDFKLSEERRTIFLFGGSQGSQYLNKIISQIVTKIANTGIQILWQTGNKEYTQYQHQITKRISIIPFIHNMANAYAISDLIICRSGALTLAEITVCGKPAILIPFSHAAGDHQKKNADSLGDAGAATVLLESTLNSNHLYHTIIKLLNNKKKINQMSTFSKKLGLPQATNDIVNYIMEENN